MLLLLVLRARATTKSAMRINDRFLKHNRSKTFDPVRQTIFNLLAEEQQKQRDAGDPIQFAW
jgi:hypothetical protein